MEIDDLITDENRLGNFSEKQKELNNNFVCIPTIPKKVLRVLGQGCVSEDEQKEHGWNSNDCSPNIRVHSDPRVFTREPVAQSTDCARGKRGYDKGLHIWEFEWKLNQRGTHAVVGVALKDSPLNTYHYCPLVGSTEHSWGWDIGRKLLYHNTGFNRFGRRRDSASEPYPKLKSQAEEYIVPDKCVAILDMDEGTLGFMADGIYLGIAHHGLKGKTVYPTVSAVWGFAEVKLNYYGSLNEPTSLSSACRLAICDAVGVIPEQINSLPLPTQLKNYLLYKV